LLGALPIAYDVSQTSTSDLELIIPIVAVLIAFLLAIVLRSLIAPLYLVASILLSYLATLGLAGIIFVHMGSESNLNFVLPLLVPAIVVLLGRWNWWPSALGTLESSNADETADQDEVAVAA